MSHILVRTVRHFGTWEAAKDAEIDYQ